MQLSSLLHSGGVGGRFRVFHASTLAHRALLLPSIISSPSPRACFRSHGPLKAFPRDKDQICDTKQVHRMVGVRTLCRAASSAGLGHPATWQLSERQWQQVDVFVDKLQEWNQRMNLTAVSGRDAILERHVADSLALLPFLDEAAAQHPEQPFTLIDVGSGAGLPGLPIAIARPEWSVTLLDSLNKRCDFLRHVIASARLSNVSVVCARAEDAGRSPELREKHKAAVARAVADMRVLGG